MNVRKAGVADALAVVRVMNAVIEEGRYTIFDRPFTHEEETCFIASLGPRSALFVAETEGVIAGVQVVDLFSNLARSVSHVATVGTWLLPQFRGQQIGRMLFEASSKFARESGYRKLLIQVLASNERALRFYRGLGFTDIGVAKQHVCLAGEFHDEVYLEKLLG